MNHAPKRLPGDDPKFLITFSDLLAATGGQLAGLNAAAAGIAAAGGSLAAAPYAAAPTAASMPAATQAVQAAPGKARSSMNLGLISGR